MILQSLNEYYCSLLGQGEISPPGWDDSCKVSYGLELNEDGELIALIPYQRTVVQGTKEKVIHNRLMRVPARVKRAVGISSNFLCDTSTYLLGADDKGKPQRAQSCFRACRELHESLLDKIDSPAAKAILAFFAKWCPETAAEHPVLAQEWVSISSGCNLAFCYDMEFAAHDAAVQGAWQNHFESDSEETEIGRCLVTGEMAPIARLHPSIKGVQGAQSSGASLVSFNASAFESYGHSQGSNAPVSEYAAFAYTTALNTLAADREHCKTIGDTTVVCWSESGQRAYQDIGMFSLFGGPPGVDDNDIVGILHRMARGEPCQWKDIVLNPEEHFYFLGLAPNASRLSVRFFLKDSFGDFMKNIDRHYQDMEIVHSVFDEREHISLWQLLNETVNQNSRTKSASPQMAGSVMRAILTGSRYPASLLNHAEIRIRAERNVTRGRAAIIKAYYLRCPHPDCPKEVLQVELNQNSKDTAYTLGRMFSVFEQIQMSANPGINTTIKDKYFNSASATPSLIFPVLGNLAQKHLRVLRRDKKGLAVILERRLEELMIIIGDVYPDHLTLPQQGSFQLGYYFEDHFRYQKKEEE